MERLRSIHGKVVLYDAHSIRSRVPRLFDGELPLFNIGTNDGRSCAPELERAVAAVCAESGEGHVVNGRFKGGWTTRHHGAPDSGVHAIQMELAMRGYLLEPDQPSPENWPPRPDPARLAHLQPILTRVLRACLAFAGE
jgi:formiminoglutamase